MPRTYIILLLIGYYNNSAISTNLSPIPRREATAEHLARVGQAPSDQCWWCGSGERPQATNAGGAEAASGKRGSIFSSDAGGGNQRLKGCGRGTRGTTGRVERAPRSAFCSETYEQRRRFWSSRRAPRWGRCRAGSLWRGVRAWMMRS